MDNFEENVNTKIEELVKNLTKFNEKKVHSAGTKARKNAQELKALLQDLRKDILDEQKKRKEAKSK